MPDIKLANGSSATAIKLGATSIQKVYQGSTLLWTRTPTFDIAMNYASTSPDVTSDTDNMANHDWSTTYGCTAFDISSTSSTVGSITITCGSNPLATDLYNAIPTSIGIVTDPGGTYAGPSPPQVIVKADWTVSGNTVATSGTVTGQSYAAASYFINTFTTLTPNIVVSDNYGIQVTFV